MNFPAAPRLARAKLLATVCRLFTLLLVLSTLIAASTALAQERYNYLAVNGVLLDEAGPFYFIAQGDNRNAFAKAAPLAEAMGLTLAYDGDAKVLALRQGTTIAQLPATGDIAAGLVKADGILDVDGRRSASPHAILVDGVAYVPISPIVTAFEGKSSWNADKHIIVIETADRLGYIVEAPRTGLTAGVSRIAFDVPMSATFSVAVDGDALVVSLPGARADASHADLEDPNLRSINVSGRPGAVSIVVRTRYPLSADGNGFRVGSIDKAGSRTVYVDFGQAVTGMPVATLLTTDPSQPQALAAAPDRPRVVVIDAGHGGKDPGTSSAFATEDKVVLAVALKLKKLLEDEGIHVIMTRSDDTFLTLSQRSGFATTERNLFVSIHANSAPSSSASGIETWVFGKPLDPSLIDRAIRENGGGAEGQALTDAARASADDIAGDILSETQVNMSSSLAHSLQQSLVTATGARDRGVRQNLFYVIRTARIPAVLVEVGFVSNPDEGSKLATDAYQQLLAGSLADGIVDFLHGGGMLARR